MSAAISFLNFEIIQVLAWIFTVLSAMVSIALTIHKFGLTPGKRLGLIVGVIVVGLGAAAVLIPNAKDWGLFDLEELAGSKSNQVDSLALIKELSKDPRFGGIEMRPDGSYQIFYLSQAVQRPDNADLFQVELAGEKAGETKSFLAYSGTAIEAKIGGQKKTVEILDTGSDDIIVAAGDDVAVVKPEGAAAGDSKWVKNATRVRAR